MVVTTGTRGAWHHAPEEVQAYGALQKPPDGSSPDEGWERYENSFCYRPEEMSAKRVLEAPLNALRLDYAQYYTACREGKPPEDFKNPTPRQAFDHWAERLQSLLPDEPEMERRQFAQESEKARHAIVQGTTRGAAGGGPNPNSRYRQLLWSMALHAATQQEILDQGVRASLEAQLKAAKEGTNDEQVEALQAELDELPKRSGTEELQRELAGSSAMQQMKQKFVARTRDAKHGIGPRDDKETPLFVQYGPPNSWFFNAQQKDNPKQRGDIINLDLFWTLFLGGFIDPIFFHELSHQEKSLSRPAFVQQPHDEAEALKQQMKAMVDANPARDGSVAKSAEYQRLAKEYAIKMMEAKLLHRFWNSAEDNMCDQDNRNRVGQDVHPYPVRLDIGINGVRTLIGGVGAALRNGQSFPEDAEQYSAIDRFNEANRAINYAFYIRNHICDDTPQGWKSIGVDTRVLGGDEIYRDEVRPLCDQIAYAQPHLSRWMNKAGYAQECVRTCNTRNAIIANLFEKHMRTLFEEAMKEFKQKPLEEQMQQLKQAIDNAGDGPPGGKGQGGGEGLPVDLPGGGTITIPGTEEETEPGKGEGQEGGPQAIDNPEAAEDLDKAAHREQPDPDRPGERPNKADGPAAPAPAATTIPSNGGRSRGTSALVALDINDRRSLQELRKGTDYQQAVREVAEEFKAIARGTPQVVTGYSDTFHTREFNDFNEQFDVEEAATRHMQHMTGREADNGAHFREESIRKIESPGDIFLMIDTSGSMGKKKGSPLEAAIKSALILSDAASQAGFGVYVSFWGNLKPTLLVHPGMNEQDREAALSRAWEMGHEGKLIHGLHGGTELDPPIANMFAHLSQQRTDEVGRRPNKIRGPVYGLVLTDGIVGEKSAQHIGRALKACPALTFDAAITNNQESHLQGTLERVAVTHAPPHQRPIYQQIENTGETAVKVVDWAKERMQLFLQGLRADGNRWNITNKKLNQDAGRAGTCYCQDHPHGMDWNAHTRLAREQRRENRPWAARGSPEGGGAALSL